jgi:TRAP-type mannitol/chloroaromatic compound transport system permease small subunit
LSDPEVAKAPERLSLLDHLVVSLNAIGSLWVLLLVLLICTDSFGRSFFRHPIEGAVEMVAVSMAVIVFCQLPDTTRIGRLTRSDTLLHIFATKMSWPGRLVLAGFDLLGALVMAQIVYGMAPLVLEAYERGYYLGNRGLFTFPEWPLKGLVVMGASVTFVCFLVRAYKAWRDGTY